MPVVHSSVERVTGAARPLGARPADRGPVERVRRYPALGWVVLMTAVVAGIMLGIALDAALSVELDGAFLIHAQAWMSWATAGLCVGVVSVVVGVVAVVVCRPRTVAVVALVAALTLPTIGAIIGLKLGGDVFAGRLVDLSTDAVGAIRELSEGHVSLEALLTLAYRLFG